MFDILEIIVSAEKLPQMDMSYGGGKGYNPLSELMRALVLRAVDDLSTVGEFRDEALEWLYSDEEEYIFSFRAICQYMGFDAEKTRHLIIHPTHKISTRRRAA